MYNSLSYAILAMLCQDRLPFLLSIAYRYRYIKRCLSIELNTRKAQQCVSLCQSMLIGQSKPITQILNHRFTINNKQCLKTNSNKKNLIKNVLAT